MVKDMKRFVTVLVSLVGLFAIVLVLNGLRENYEFAHPEAITPDRVSNAPQTKGDTTSQSDTRTSSAGDAAATPSGGVDMARFSESDAAIFLWTLRDNRMVVQAHEEGSLVELAEGVCATLEEGLPGKRVLRVLTDNGYTVNEASLIIVAAASAGCPD